MRTGKTGREPLLPRAWATIGLLMTVAPALGGANLFAQTSAPEGSLKIRKPPTPLPDHPGNILVEGENVRIPWPQGLPSTTPWHLLDDRHQELGHGATPNETAGKLASLELGPLEIGWYRLEFGSSLQPDQSSTTLAVLRRQRNLGDSPVAVDVAAAWLARNDGLQQKKLANLAALAGVSWVRDRLRWNDLQPSPGALLAPPTTYDSSADAFSEVGLKVLQVLHDTPPWARENPQAGGRFAPDPRPPFPTDSLPEAWGGLGNRASSGSSSR